MSVSPCIDFKPDCEKVETITEALITLSATMEDIVPVNVEPPNFKTMSKLSEKQLEQVSIIFDLVKDDAEMFASLANVLPDGGTVTALESIIECLGTSFVMEAAADEVAQKANDIRKSQSYTVRQSFNAIYNYQKMLADQGDLNAKAIYDVMASFYSRSFGRKSTPLKSEYSSPYQRVRGGARMFQDLRSILSSNLPETLALTQGAIPTTSPEVGDETSK